MLKRKTPSAPEPKDPNDGVDWLRWLHDELNEFVPAQGPRGVSHLDFRRKITAAEWARVQELVQTLKLVCTPHNGCWGFNFAVVVHATPVYPGLPCEGLLEINGPHFDLRFAEAWEKLAPLTHNDENAKLLELYKFEKLREREHYDY